MREVCSGLDRYGRKMEEEKKSKYRGSGNSRVQELWHGPYRCGIPHIIQSEREVEG
jgi:hypothetical protein